MLIGFMGSKPLVSQVRTQTHITQPRAGPGRSYEVRVHLATDFSIIGKLSCSVKFLISTDISPS